MEAQGGESRPFLREGKREQRPIQQDRTVGKHKHRRRLYETSLYQAKRQKQTMDGILDVYLFGFVYGGRSRRCIDVCRQFLAAD